MENSLAAVTGITEEVDGPADNQGEVSHANPGDCRNLFGLFLVMGVLATVAVLSETRGMPGSVWKYKRARGPQKQ